MFEQRDGHSGQLPFYRVGDRDNSDCVKLLGDVSEALGVIICGNLASGNNKEEEEGPTIIGNARGNSKHKLITSRCDVLVAPASVLSEVRTDPPPTVPI